MADNSSEQGTGVQEQAAEMAEATPRKSFWQHPFVQNVLPFATSVVLHAGVLLLGYATYEAVKTVSTVIRDQIIIPDATIVEGAEVGGVPNPGLGTDPNIVSDMKVDIQEQTQKLTEKSASIASGLGGETASEGVIGVGASTVALGRGTGAGAGDAGATPFGVPGGSGGMGPKSPFMGVSGNAYRVVYLVDASGSMMPRKSLVVQALKESIDKLKPVQFFNVIFFHFGDVDPLDKAQLIPASPANKRKAFEFADEMQAEQQTDPSKAITLAMGMKPQLVYFLTDGFDSKADDFAKRLRAQFTNLNKGREVHVNIIYIADEQQFKELGGTNDAKRSEIISELKAIAEENGGRFKAIDSNGDTY